MIGTVSWQGGWLACRLLARAPRWVRKSNGADCRSPLESPLTQKQTVGVGGGRIPVPGGHSTFPQPISWSLVLTQALVKISGDLIACEEQIVLD